MLKKRLVRMLVAHIFDQLSDETLELVNEIVDAEIEERLS